jgi:chaperonin cofactor prefoldin
LEGDTLQEQKERDELHKLEAARETVRKEVRRIRDMYDAYDERCKKLKQEIDALTSASAREEDHTVP